MLPRVIVFKAVARTVLAFFMFRCFTSFPAGRSGGLAEREPQFNFDKYEIDLLRCKGVTKGRMVCVQHSSLLDHFISFWRLRFASPAGQKRSPRGLV